MTAHRRLVTAATVRQVRAVGKLNRLASRSDATVRVALQTVLRSLPDQPTPHSAPLLARIVAHVVHELGRQLRSGMRGGLIDLAAWGYLEAARMVTARAKGRLKVRRAEDERTDLYRTLIIDPPDASFLSALVGPAPDRLTSIVAPDRAAGLIWQGIAAGQDRKKIAASLTDLFGGYAVAARRVARTEGLRVATATQLAASEQVSELIPAYQIVAVLDSRTRPEHRARNGTIYYRNPRPGQLGFDVMPHPPIDPGGVIAYNCRCILIPVFETADVMATPDPDSMADWWSGASEPEREVVAGATRLELTRRELGREPSWFDLIDASGHLIAP